MGNAPQTVSLGDIPLITLLTNKKDISSQWLGTCSLLFQHDAQDPSRCLDRLRKSVTIQVMNSSCSTWYPISMEETLRFLTATAMSKMCLSMKT